MKILKILIFVIVSLLAFRLLLIWLVAAITAFINKRKTRFKTEKIKIENSYIGTEIINFVLFLAFNQLYIVGMDNAIVLNISTLESYMYFVIAGIVTVLYCTMTWSLKILSLPRINSNEIAVAYKKAGLFSLVLIFTLMYGLEQVKSIIGGSDLDETNLIINITIVSSIIAFDRVMSQIATIARKSKEKK